MGGRRWKHEEVATYFQQHGCELLAANYEGCNQALSYRCGCGAETYTTFRAFKHTTLKGVRKGCGFCQYKHMMETTTAKHGGKHHFQTEEFKKKREQTYKDHFGVPSPLLDPGIQQKMRDTCMERYGVTHAAKNPVTSIRRKESFYRKHGVRHFMHLPESRAKFYKTLFENHGVPSLAHLSHGASKESQIFFWALYRRLPEALQDKCYFAELNKEFNTNLGGEYFKFDFVQSTLKKAIEYNGSKFHPKDGQAEHETGWCVFHPQKTVKEAREYESRKYESLISRGFQILTIWDTEFHLGLDNLVEKSLAFLLGE